MPVHITPLTPLAFLERSQDVFADATAVVHGDRRMTYRELGAEVTRVARALRASGVGPGDRVAYLCPNTPTLLVAHFAVPLAGAVLVAVNTRLAPVEVRAICAHSGARMIVADTELAGTLAPVIDDLPVAEVVWDDGAAPVPEGLPGARYAQLAARGSDAPLPWAVEDEDATIAINYTSGTTGAPKGVMYTHRGAYLNSLGENLTAGHGQDTRLPLDAADVPLQRLVPPVGDRRLRRRPGVPAGRARRRDLAADRRGGHHPPQRRSGGALPAGQLGPGPPARAPAHRGHGRRAAQPDDPGPDRGARARASCTSTGSPRPTAPTPCASGRPAGPTRSPPSAPACSSRQGVAMVIADPIRVVDEAGAEVPARRGDRGRDRDERQQRDEGLLRATPRARRRPSGAACSTRATSACGTPTATSSCATGPRT